ncbi:MAG: alpha/beta hydrolase domain-containing protein [Dermatophilus congolensis]|nr:alpha/beta hydrolase domain-containing protein [Dermatophilus congolensis]
MNSRDALPTVVAVPVTEGSRPFNSTVASTVPLDLAVYGYVEEEFFVSGVAAVYADDLSVMSEVPYTNRVVVRRPAEAPTASGVVLLEILNASNGYPAEGLWRRAWDHLLLHRHTWVGFTSKPIDIDALKIFDPARYAPLSWDIDPAHPHPPVSGAGLNALGAVVDGAEEGLVWDVVTHMARLLRREMDGAPDASVPALLGGAQPTTLILGGQSQSGVVLNTWLRHFHPLVRQADGRSMFDGYLVSVASVVERPLRQQVSPDGRFATTPPGDAAPVDVPLVSVFSEGDVALWAGHGQIHTAAPGLGDGERRRSWCVPGGSHTELFTPAIPSADEVRRADRKPRATTAQAALTGNPFPFEAFVTSAFDAVLRWATTGEPAAPSRFFDLDPTGALARDSDGNVTGGVRAGLHAQAIAAFHGGTGGTGGTLTLLPRDEVLRRYPTPDDYLAAVSAVDAQLVTDGYLTDWGRRQLWTAAVQLYLRAAA